MIDVKGLTKTYGDHQVLKGINEHISKGEKVAIIGAFRFGQVHLPALPQPAGGAHFRHHYL